MLNAFKKESMVFEKTKIYLAIAVLQKEKYKHALFFLH
jgi:hypothetical protein